MKGYKAFEKGMICKGKQYAENTVFEEENAEICQSGMHFCKNPLDVLDYYPLFNEKGEMTEFAEVEALDEPITDDNEKYCTKKLKIGAKLSLGEFIKSSFSFIKESCMSDKKAETRKRKNSKLAASGYSSKLAASGDSSQLAASGDYSQLAASGDSSKLAASGDSSKLAASGYYSQLAASGDSSKLAASGDYSQLAASGDSSQLAASGDSSQLELNGKNSVGANIGKNGRIKGKKGNWIVLAEYDGKGKPLCVKSAQIDGIKIKEDTFYKLENGEFVEA